MLSSVAKNITKLDNTNGTNMSNNSILKTESKQYNSYLTFLNNIIS